MEQQNQKKIFVLKIIAFETFTVCNLNILKKRMNVIANFRFSQSGISEIK